MNRSKINNKPKIWQHKKIYIPTSLLIFNLLILINISKAKAQPSIAFAGIDTLVDKAIDLLYHKKYFDAIDICENVITTYPENPMGYLGQAAVYHIIMLTYRINLFDTEFDSLTSLAIDIGEKAINRYEDDANTYFVLGAAYGFRGLHRIRKGEWFGAFRDGLRGVSNLKKAHEKDETLYDVYYGLGLYYYWKSVKAKVLTFLRLMKDERDKGIEYLKIANEKGRFSSMEALFALIEIYYYEDRYEEALDQCLSLDDKFSKDPSWNYLTAKVLDKLSRWEEAKHYFLTLLTLLQESQFKSNSYLAECHYSLAKCSFELKDYETARNELNLASELSKLWDKEKEMEGPLLDFDKVLARIKSLDEELSKLDFNE